MNRSESPPTALRTPSPPLGEKDGMRGYGSWVVLQKTAKHVMRGRARSLAPEAVKPMLLLRVQRRGARRVEYIRPGPTESLGPLECSPSRPGQPDLIRNQNLDPSEPEEVVRAGVNGDRGPS